MLCSGARLCVCRAHLRAVAFVEMPWSPSQAAALHARTQGTCKSALLASGPPLVNMYVHSAQAFIPLPKLSPLPWKHGNQYNAVQCRFRKPILVEGHTHGSTQSEWGAYMHVSMYVYICMYERPHRETSSTSHVCSDE